MKIDLNLDARQLEQRFSLTAKNIAYATVNAINQTALDVQRQAQENVKSRFTLRNPQFVLRQAAIIKPFANVRQGRPYAEISVGQKPRLLLADFEQGGARLPFVGRREAVPIPGSAARPSFAQPVPAHMRFEALRLQPPLSAAQRKQRTSIKGGNARETREARAQFTRAQGAGKVWRGDERTYMIPGLGVFQRTGSGKRDTQLVYKFLPSVQLKPKLGFLATAKDYGANRFSLNLDDAIKGEISRARR